MAPFRSVLNLITIFILAPSSFIQSSTRQNNETAADFLNDVCGSCAKVETGINEERNGSEACYVSGACGVQCLINPSRNCHIRLAGWSYEINTALLNLLDDRQMS